MSATENDSLVSAHGDPPGEPPWAMQLVVRVEKPAPPSCTAVLEASAMAVVRLLIDERRNTEPGWEHSFDRWMQGRIRKHVRRARGAKWAQVQDLPGLTVEHRGAQVRAFVPTSVDDIYPEIAKMQLSGRDLDDQDRVEQVEHASGVLAVAISPDPPLAWTKAAAAAAHASQVAWLGAPPEFHDPWVDAGFPVVVEHPDVTRWHQLLEQAPVRIRDAGLTHVEAGTTTSLAWWA